jgi:hypothetical protein
MKRAACRFTVSSAIAPCAAGRPARQWWRGSASLGRTFASPRISRPRTDRAVTPPVVFAHTAARSSPSRAMSIQPSSTSRPPASMIRSKPRLRIMCLTAGGCHGSGSTTTYRVIRTRVRARRRKYRPPDALTARWASGQAAPCPADHVARLSHGARRCLAQMGSGRLPQRVVE